MDSLNTEELSSLESAIMGIVMFIAAVIVIVGILKLAEYAGRYKTFKKMGLPGWSGIIPVYNRYPMYKAVWSMKVFYIWLVAYTLLLVAVFAAFAFLPLILILPLLYIAVFVRNLILMIKLARAFGRGAGFGWFLAILPPLAFPVLGFGRSSYRPAVQKLKEVMEKDDRGYHKDSVLEEEAL